MYLVNAMQSRVPIHVIGQLSPIEYSTYSAEYTVVLNEYEYNFMNNNKIEEVLDRMVALEEENRKLTFLLGEN